jgi:Cu+-exporting ATPase
MHITLPSAAVAPAGTTPQGRAWSLPVQGMTCASCVARVEKVARLVPGVLQADVNLATETLHLQTSAAFDPAPLKQVVERAGYTLATTELQLPISDMSCASCVARVEKALRQVPGVLDASVNLATETASVTLSGEAADLAPLVAAVTRAGYGVAAPLAAQARSQPWLSEGRRVLLAALLSAPLALPMLAMFWGQPLDARRPLAAGCWRRRCSSGSAPASTRRVGLPCGPAPAAWTCWSRWAPVQLLA